MSRTIRVAMTQTKNAYAKMPSEVDSLEELRDHLPAIREANVNHHIALAQLAAQQSVKAICFGELFTGPYFALDKRSMWRGMAENADTGPTVTALAAVAAELQILIVAPIYERTPEGAYFNTAIVIENDGSLLGKYRKCHIPEGANDQGSFHETFYYERSDGQLGNTQSNASASQYFPVFETSIGKIGIAICYDRHFPGVVQTLAAQGAELVFSPAVTFGEKSRRMWAMEFAVDAARHNVFIGGSNRIGAEAPWQQEFFGASHFVGPNGPANPIPSDSRLIVTDLDLDELTREDPAGWNFARDSRQGIYQ